jgi:hypothetical protein
VVASSEHGVQLVDASDPKAPLFSSVIFLSGEVVALHAVDGLALVDRGGHPQSGAFHGSACR